MPIEAIINIGRGEKQYKCMNSDWLVDEQGPIMFRMLSKIKADGNVEAVMFSQRQDNRKYIYHTSTFPPADFNKYFSAIREGLWQFFPGARFETVDFADLGQSSYVTASISLGKWPAMLKMRIYWFFGALRNKIMWIIFKKMPK